MIKEEVQKRCRLIKYELAKGIHTYTMCDCNRNSSRSGKCWECYLDELFYNKLTLSTGKDGEVK